MSTERQESKLVRNLGFWDLMGIAVGQIIGAGIMSSTGVAIGMTGTGIVLAFLLSPFLTLITISPIAIMSSAVPATGGLYRYVSRLLGKTQGVLYLLLYGFQCLMISTFALSFGTYFQSLMPSADAHVVAMIIMTLFFITNLIGTRSAAILNTIMTVCLIGGLMLFVVFGLGKVDVGYVFNPSNLFAHGGMAFVSALALLSSATGGAQQVAELGGEAKNPGSTIPRVIIVSTLSVGVLYVLIAIVAAGVLPIEQVENQTLSLVADAIMPKAAFYMFVIGAALGATATTLNATLSTAIKPFLVACDDGLLPKSLATVSKNGVPYKILTIFYICGMIPLLFRLDLAFIATFTTANSLLAKVFVCYSLSKITIKYAKELANCPLKMSAKMTKVISFISIIVLCTLSISLFMNLQIEAVIFVACLVVIAVVYAKKFLKTVEIPDDLGVDYSTQE